MAEYEFYADEKITVWRRDYLYVEADSKEDAIKKLQGETLQNGISSTINMYGNDDNEILWDTCCTMSIEKNGGNATIEIFDTNDNEIITNKSI